MLADQLISNRNAVGVPTCLWQKLTISPLTVVESTPLPPLQQKHPNSYIRWLWTLFALVLWIIENFHSHLTSAQTNGTPSPLDTPIINCSECVCCSLFASSIRQVHIHRNYFSVGFQWKKHIAGKPCASISSGLQIPQRGCLLHIQSLAPCFIPSPWHHGQPKQLVAPARSGISQSPLGMRQSLTKKAELMFPRSKEKGRCLSRALPLPVVCPRLAVNLGCLSGPKLFSHVHRKTDASHSRAPCSSQALSAKPAGRVHSRDSRDTASCLWPL